MPTSQKRTWRVSDWWEWTLEIIQVRNPSILSIYGCYIEGDKYILYNQQLDQGLFFNMRYTYFLSNICIDFKPELYRFILHNGITKLITFSTMLTQIP